MKRTLAIMLSSVLMLCLCGCRNRKDSETAVFEPRLPVDQEVSLTVMGIWGNNESLEAVFNDFNVYYPNVSLTYEYTDNILNSVENRCASGENLDITFIHSIEFDYYFKEVSDKYFIDLNETDIDMSCIDRKYLDAVSRDGEQKFLPVFLEMQGFLVNKTLLENYGLAVPSTLEEFEICCQTFVDNGITPILSCNAGVNLMGFNRIVFSLMSSPDKGRILADLYAGNDTYGIFEEAMKMVDGWYDRGFINLEANDFPDRYNSVIMRFLEGDIPFATGSADTVSGVRKRTFKSEAYQQKPFDFVFMPSPTGKDGYECVCIPSLLYSICNFSGNIDYATEFLRFLCTEEELCKLTVIKGMPTVYTDTGDPRLAIYENLDENEVFITGHDGFGTRLANAVYYSLSNVNTEFGNPDAVSMQFMKIMSKYRD